MFKRISPIFRLSLGITSLVLSLLLMAQFFGLIPNSIDEKLSTRAGLSEALTIQISAAAANNDLQTVNSVISTVVQRDPNVRSIALRKHNGDLIASTKRHADYWHDGDEVRSSPTHVHVNLFNGETPWGRLEIAFKEIDAAVYWTGIPKETLLLVAYVMISCLFGTYMLLRKALKSLDPGNVVPGRVQSAFDTLSEGVAIIDEKERILLANKMLLETTQREASELIGTKIGDLPWRMWERKDDDKGNGIPWQTAIDGRENSVQVPMGLRLASDEIRNYNINASCILDGNSKATGAIVTFSDVTILEKQNIDLANAVEKLKLTEEEISKQNLELRYLANHDPLTGSLNRRSFFELLNEKFVRAKNNGTELVCLMVDLDHFKSINDQYGHAIGDDVIAGCAALLSSSCREQDLVGRYGGEEFCVALEGLSLEESRQIAERIRADVMAKSSTWIAQGKNATVSIGLASISSGADDPNELVDQADQALYRAKQTGRNQVIDWETLHKSTRVEDKPVPAVAEQTAPVVSAPEPVEAPTIDPQIAQEPTMEAIDKLTGMPKLDTFNERLLVSIERAKREGKATAVVCLSIDSMPQLTSVYGSSEANLVLQKASERITNLLRRSDTIALLNGKDRLLSYSRFNDHSFLIEVSHLDEVASVTWVIQRLFDDLAKPVPIEDKEHYLRISAGISLFPEDGQTAEDLIHCAGVAQQHAHKNGKSGSLEFYSENMSQIAKQQLLIEIGIREALEHNQFSLSYQPIVSVATGQLMAAEALLRCDNPKLMGIPIDMLIAVSEQTGLMEEVGEWVLKEALIKLSEWKASGLILPKLSVNVSADQLSSEESSKRLMSTILESSCDPKSIQIEVTETALLKDIDRSAVTLQKLQQLGVQIALDDFGTGQSSLAYVQKLNPDTIKIDKCFVQDIHMNRSNEAMVAAVSELAARLGLRVVAEGVESIEELDMLKNLGCDEIQGYLISQPMPVSVFEDWLGIFAASNQTLSPINRRLTA